MEYKVLSGSWQPGELERSLNSHAAAGWRVVSAFQAISWWSSLLALNGLRVSEATGADIEALGIE